MVETALSFPIRPISGVLADRFDRRILAAYEWDKESSELAARLDFVAHADELAASGAAIELIVGADDDREGFIEPARALAAALPGAELSIVEGMGHELALLPGHEPAPQIPAAATVDALASDWLRNKLAFH